MGPLVEVAMPYISGVTLVFAIISIIYFILPFKLNSKILGALFNIVLVIIALTQGSIAAFVPESATFVSYVYLFTGIIVVFAWLLRDSMLKKLEKIDEKKENDKNE